MVDIPGNSSTTVGIVVGGTVTDSLEVVGDHDWFRITLEAGQTVTITLNGTTLEDPYLRIRNSSGTLVDENDDISSGVNRDSRLNFTATTSGTYYIDVGAWNEDYAGQYQLSVTTYVPPSVWTYDQIADQLTSGYWGGTAHRFNVSARRTDHRQSDRVDRRRPQSRARGAFHLDRHHRGQLRFGDEWRPDRLRRR